VIWFDIPGVFIITRRAKKINNVKSFGTIFAENRAMIKKVILIFILIFSAQISFAEVYKWVDEQGTVHFTDDLTLVPEKYRSKSNRMELPEGSEQSTGSKKENATSPPPSLYKDRMGRGEEYWKGRVEELRNRLKILEEKAENLRSEYNQLTEKINLTRSSVERGNLRRERDQMKSEIDECRTEIEAARDGLEKRIPEEAKTYNAKPDWLR